MPSTSQPQTNPKYQYVNALYGSLVLFETTNRDLQHVDNTLVASLTGKRLTHIITPESFRALYTHHLRDLLEQKRVPNIALFEAFYNYCFVPKHTIGTQLLTVRRDKREREAFAAAQESVEIEEEDDESEEGFRVSLGENMGFREDTITNSE